MVRIVRHLARQVLPYVVPGPRLLPVAEYRWAPIRRCAQHSLHVHGRRLRRRHRRQVEQYIDACKNHWESQTLHVHGLSKEYTQISTSALDQGSTGRLPHSRF